MMLGFIALLLAISQVGAVLLIVIWGGAAWCVRGGAITGHWSGGIVPLLAE
jgi:hypothetical protein